MAHFDVVLPNREKIIVVFGCEQKLTDVTIGVRKLGFDRDRCLLGSTNLFFN